MLALTLLLSSGTNRSNAQTKSDEHSPVFGVFVGSSPSSEELRTLLEIPAEAESPIQWNLTLYGDAKASAPLRYHLQYQYRLRDDGLHADQRDGRWRIAKATKSNLDAVVYRLDDNLAFVKVDDNVLHLLDRDRNLMVGNSGWSYTLNRTTSLDESGDLSVALARPSESYKLPPLPTGPSVFGVFSGRTPGQRIRRELNLPKDVGCIKIKWRVTLYQDPKTKAPTTYEVHSSLHRPGLEGAREGIWSIIQGTETNPKTIIYRLASTKNEAALFLLKGDDNVLFFVDEKQQLLTGTADFSYTLNGKKS
jgi:hypothetical protein